MSGTERRFLFCFPFWLLSQVQEMLCYWNQLPERCRLPPAWSSGWWSFSWKTSQSPEKCKCSYCCWVSIKCWNSLGMWCNSVIMETKREPTIQSCHCGFVNSTGHDHLVHQLQQLHLLVLSVGRAASPQPDTCTEFYGDQQDKRQGCQWFISRNYKVLIKICRTYTMRNET